MKNVVNKISGTGGFTLLELLIALALTGFVTAAIFKLYVSQHKHYITQTDVADIQQGARAAIGEMSRQIRMAGYQLPLGLNAIEASNTNPDTVTVTYRSSDCETYLAAAMTQPTSELECATSVSCFKEGEWAYIFEPDSGGGEWFEISGVLALDGRPGETFC